jgi:hypothetical protein
VDQIVLSGGTYLTSSPGRRDNDTTILPVASASTIAVRAAAVATSAIHGAWQRITDATASSGFALSNPNTGQPKVSPALASPANYWEATFTAQAGVAYHLWVRLRAQSDSLANDSVHVQFSDSVAASGSTTMRIGTTSSAEVVLQNGSGDPSVHGWGWADNGWGALGANIQFATTGVHTVRVQQREDGAIIDELLLSPDAFLTASPGTRDNDVVRQ